MIVPDDDEGFCQIVVAVTGRRNLRRVQPNAPFECAYTYPHRLQKGWICLSTHPEKSHSKTRHPAHKIQLDRRNMCPCQDSSKTKIHIGERSDQKFKAQGGVVSLDASIHVIIMLSCDRDRRVNWAAV